MAGTPQRRKEQTFSSKERRLDLSDILNVKLNRRLKGNDASGINPQHLAHCQFALILS